MAYRSPLGFQRPVFQPQCTHLTMTRLHGDYFVCEACHRPGAFGWVYRCTQDREEMIEQAISRGFTARLIHGLVDIDKVELTLPQGAFDKVGEEFTNGLAMRKGSPAFRSDRLSFLGEITPEQMCHYHPKQLAKVLRQREEVQLVAYRDKLRKNSTLQPPLFGRFREPEAPSPYGGVDFPWVSRNDEECQYKICPYCRPACADRAYMSLNAVANGDVLPTAAAGFGFHTVNRRPVADVNIVKNIGLRGPPKPRYESICTDSTFASEFNMMEMLDEQIAQSCNIWRSRNEARNANLGAMQSVFHKSPGRLRHSPGYDNLNRAAVDEPIEVVPQGALVRPPWTPPPSPSQQEKEKGRGYSVPGLAAEPILTNGRSSVSLKTNPSVRNQLLTSVPSSSALARMQQSIHSMVDNRQVPYLDEMEYDVGLTLPFNRDAFEQARNTPLAPPDVIEEVFLQGHLSPMIEDEEHEGRFRPAPLMVDHGVAVLEESVELGVPDVITQV